ncbi:MAG: peptidylprolyl isomerase [Deltaproteobacteria bacterium]|nr:peptidylprolyl isomerase [Deltaproteobacteria bacterium]
MRKTLASILTATLLASVAPALAAPGKPAAGKKLIVERVVAVVNDAVILESELRARLLPVLNEAMEITDLKERERRIAKLQGSVLDDMISEDLIVQAAEAAKIEVDSTEVQAALDEIKQQNKLDDAGLSQVLAQQGFTLSNYRADLRRQLLRLRAVNQLVAPKVTITEEDIRARYDQLQRRSDSVSSVKLSHILVKLPPNATEQQTAEAKDRATKAFLRVKGGEEFATVVADVSDDTGTKATGGELGWFQRGSINADWEPVVFSMDKDEVRGPVVGPQGFEVFLVTEVKKSELKPYAEMKEQLQRELKRREMDKQTQTWVEDLRKKAYIDIKLQ